MPFNLRFLDWISKMKTLNITFYAFAFLILNTACTPQSSKSTSESSSQLITAAVGNPQPSAAHSLSTLISASATNTNAQLYGQVTGFTTPVAPQSTGVIPVAVFVVHMDGGYAAVDVTAAQANQAVFTGQADGFSAKQWLNQASGGLTNISGSVYEVTITGENPNAACNMAQWKQKIKQAALSVGYNPDLYSDSRSKFIYFIPPQANCGCASGSSGALGEAWIGHYDEGSWLVAHGTDMTFPYPFLRQSSESTLLHEIGHAFGLNHEGILHCMKAGAKVSQSDDCVLENYGDNYSIMGRGGSLGKPGAAQLEQLGWQQATQVTASGNFSISPIDASLVAGTSSSLKFTRSTVQDPTLSQSKVLTQYFVYRRSVANKSYGTYSGNSVNGVFVQIARPYAYRYYQTSMTQQPSLIRMKFGNTDSDMLLLVGETFTDPLTGASIKLNSIAANGVANVSVNLPSVIAPPANPFYLSAQIISSSSVKLHFIPANDARENQASAFRITIDEKESYNFAQCESYGSFSFSIAGQSQGNSSLCNSVDFLLERMSSGKTHQIKVQSIDLFGTASPGISLQVALPAGPDVSPPLPAQQFQLVQAQATSSTNSGSISLSWSPAKDDSGKVKYTVIATREADILANQPDIQYLRYDSELVLDTVAGSAVLTGYAGHTLNHGDKLKIRLQAQDAAGNWDMQHLPYAVTPEILVTIP